MYLHNLEIKYLKPDTDQPCVPAFLVATGRRKHTQVDFLWITRRFRTIAAFTPTSPVLQDTRYKSIYWQPRKLDCHIHNTQNNTGIQ